MPPAFPWGRPGHLPRSWGLRERAEVVGKHLFPTPPQSGGMRGALASCSHLAPPPSTPEVRTGFQAQVQAVVATAGGSHEQLRAHGHDTHPTHRQTATQTALEGSPARHQVESRLPGQGGVGGDFGYRALKAAVFQASKEAQCSQGPLTPALPCTAGWGRRQLSFPISPTRSQAQSPFLASIHAGSTLSGFQLYSSF